MLTNRQLMLPYAAPYLAYVGIASLLVGVIPAEASYLLRMVAVGLLIRWAWPWYCSLRGPYPPAGSILLGLAAGLAGLLIWLALLAPFVKPGDGTPWTTSAFLLRLCSAGALVPVFEEMLMRGFVFRLALQWDQLRKAGASAPLHAALDKASVNDVRPGAWSWTAVLLSTLAFTSGHAPEEWVAAGAYGLLMSLLWIVRKDLLSCIAAHAATNIALALYVLTTENWHYW